MRYVIALSVLLTSAASCPALERPPIVDGGLDSGWWVVVGTGPESGSPQSSIAGSVNAAAARCGLSTFNDLSVKFSGFTPGYEVFVIGAFRSKQEATRRLEMVRPCVPSAYLKFGRYAGE